jgi:hypothetical protein
MLQTHKKHARNEIRVKKRRFTFTKWFPPKKFESLGSLPSKNLRAWSLPINIQKQKTSDVTNSQKTRKK